MTETAETTTATGTYAIDPSHSRIGFVARHAMITKVRGSFNEFEGRGHFDADEPANSQLQLTTQANSIDTRNTDRDNHLRSNEFFDMATYPELTFESTAVARAGGDDYSVTGDLTIKGVTKSVDLKTEFGGAGPDAYGGFRSGFSATTEISRKEFGVDLEMPIEGGGVVVGDKITISLEVEAVLNAEVSV